MHKHILFLLIGILLLGSCTIEKRLYNRGWHVEFHRKNKTGFHNDDATDHPVKTVVDSNITSIEAVISDQFPNLEQASEISLSNVSNNQEEYETTKVLGSSVKEKVKDLTVLKLENVFKKYYIKPWSRDAKRSSMIIVAFFLVLGIIGVIAIIFQLQTSLLLSEIIGYIFLLIVVGIVDFALMLALLAMSFTRSKEQIAEDKLANEQEKKETEQMSPQEREQAEKSQAKKDREGKIAAGFVVIVLLLILGVALL